jgi:Tol biopolymer transport system component/predicted Ser/Thr protein kinase
MALKPGSKLLHYELVEKIGEGGMGVVWKAEDTTLDRHVAIKVLPDVLGQYPERLDRFEREAKVLASLRHANIAILHGLHQTDGVRFLVMEYVAGEDLSKRLSRGPLPVVEAMRICSQVAAALQRAHDQGVIHRDLKPANVMVAESDEVKVLDFGLAKVLDPSDATDVGGTVSPTVTSGGTVPGVVLGTAAYMSPEQARGKPTDRRTDIWSFGCVLYECLTGTSQFRGETVSDSIGAVLHKTPDWSLLPTDTPPIIKLLLRRCLQKDRDRRLHDIADARVELEEAIADPEGSARVLLGDATSARPGTAGRSTIRTSLLAIGFAAVAAVTAWLLKPLPDPPRPVLRKLEFHVDGVRHEQRMWPLISPDGTRIAFVAGGSLWIRALDDLEAIELTGTEGARLPFWSPDGTQIGFHDDSRLWRMPADGGARAMICETPRRLGARGGVTWTEDGRVVFATAWGGPLWEVAEGGGEPQAIVQPDPELVRDLHHAHALPGNAGILSVVHRASGPSDRIVLIRDGELETLLEHPGQELFTPAYANGYIVYGRAQTTGTIWAAPFSLESRAVTGPSFLVAESAETPSISRDGTLVYSGGTFLGAGQLVWVDRTGAVTDVIGEPQQGLKNPMVSPDDSQAAVVATETAAWRIWIHDLERGTRRLLSRDKGARVASWVAADRLAYRVESEVYVRSVTGSNPPELLLDTGRGWATRLSPDLRYAVAEDRSSESLDISYFDLERGGGALPLMESEADEAEPAIRPGGEWVAYVSNESGREEVYVVGFPSGVGKRQVSFEGGAQPAWSQAGDELFFESDRGEAAVIMSVAVTTKPRFELGEPTRLFSGAEANINTHKGWSVSSDGQRILGVREVTLAPDTRRITVVQNWFLEFEDESR